MQIGRLVGCGRHWARRMVDQDWWTGGLVDWWIGGEVDWWTEGLLDGWIGGLVD